MPDGLVDWLVIMNNRAQVWINSDTYSAAMTAPNNGQAASTATNNTAYTDRILIPITKSAIGSVHFAAGLLISAATLLF